MSPPASITQSFNDLLSNHPVNERLVCALDFLCEHGLCSNPIGMRHVRNELLGGEYQNAAVELMRQIADADNDQVLEFVDKLLRIDSRSSEGLSQFFAHLALVPDPDVRRGLLDALGQRLGELPSSDDEDPSGQIAAELSKAFHWGNGPLVNQKLSDEELGAFSNGFHTTATPAEYWRFLMLAYLPLTD